MVVYFEVGGGIVVCSILDMKQDSLLSARKSHLEQFSYLISINIDRYRYIVKLPFKNVFSS